MKPRSPAHAPDELLRTITEELPDAIFVKDLEGRYVLANEVCARKAGLTTAAMLGHTDEELFGPEVAAIFRQHDLEAMASPHATTHEEQTMFNGELNIFSATKAAWRDERGQVCGVVGISRDITAQKVAEARLRELQERERLAFDHAPIGMALIGVDGRWRYINRALCELLGYTAQEFTQLTFEQITHPDDREQTVADATALMSGKVQRSDALKRYVRKDGTAVWVQRSASLVRDDAGQPLYFIIQLRDFTRELDMRQRVEESERQHRLLFETMADGVTYHDADGTIIAANPAAHQILGVPLRELSGRTSVHPLARLLKEDGSEYAINELPARVALRTGRPVEGVVVRVERNGGESHRWVLVNAVPQFRAGETRPYQVYSTFTDITQMRDAEEALRASEERFRALVEHATELVSIVDAEGRFSFASESFTRVLGYPPGELLGKSAFDLLHPDELAAAQQLLARAMARPDELVSGEFRAAHKTEGYRVFAARIRNMLAHPVIRGIVVNSHDITDRRNAEHALEQREEELRQAQKMEAVGRLAGGIAHDFNNVLTAITGHAEFLAEMFDETHPARGEVDEIRTAADRAARLTRQLLAFSRRQVMQPAVLDLREVLASMEKMLQRLIGEHVRLQCSTDDTPMLVKADRTHIEQVILNLAVNARDAMPSGGTVDLKLSVKEVTGLAAAGGSTPIPPGRYVQLSVSDTGTGIPAATLPKIFEPFFTTKARGLGSGLGLSTVYGIVKQSGGYVLVQSEVGRGTRFDVLLQEVSDAPAAVPDRPSAQPSPAAYETVLLVEDEAGVRNMAERVLRRQGFHVISGTNGEEALALMQAHGDTVQVVVTDVVMPRMSGRELAHVLVKTHPDIRIIFMSGYTDDEISQEGLDAAQADFLPKPFTPQELVQKVRAALNKRAQS